MRWSAARWRDGRFVRTSAADRSVMLWEVSEGDVIAVAAPELCRDVAWFSDTSLLTWSTMGVWKEGAGIDAARPVAIDAARARQVP